MLDSQPAWQLSKKDKMGNVKAVETLLRKFAEPPKHITEFFGGVGGVTSRVRHLFPVAKITSWDTDDTCVALLGKIKGVTAVKGDSINNCTPRKDDGVLMDCNIWTLLRAQTIYLPMMTRVFTAEPLWVQVADSAINKLHMNYKSYGLKSADFSAYANKLSEWTRQWGYAISGCIPAHKKTIMILFKPTKKAR